MRRQGLQGRTPKRRRCLTKQDNSAPKFSDLLRRDFTAAAPNRKWCGDVTEIGTDEGKLCLATVLDMCGRRLLACSLSDHPDAALTSDAIKMAVAVRGGRAPIDGVIFHSDRGSTYTAAHFTALCRRQGIHQLWAVSGRASIMPPARHSSPRWNTKSCPGIGLPTRLRPALS